MSFAGYELVDGRIPGQRIGQTETNSNSSDTSGGTESGSLLSVTVPLVDGRRYRIVGEFRITASAASAHYGIVRIRRGSDNAELGISQNYIDGSASLGYGPFTVAREYVAAATGDETFYLTLQRGGGSANLRLVAGSSQANRIVVDYVSG